MGWKVNDDLEINSLPASSIIGLEEQAYELMFNTSVNGYAAAKTFCPDYATEHGGKLEVRYKMVLLKQERSNSNTLQEWLYYIYT